MQLHNNIDVVKGGATLVVTKPIESWTAVLGDAVLSSGIHAWDIISGNGANDVSVGVRVGIPPATAEGFESVRLLPLPPSRFHILDFPSWTRVRELRFCVTSLVLYERCAVPHRAVDLETGGVWLL